MVFKTCSFVVSKPRQTSSTMEGSDNATMYCRTGPSVTDDEFLAADTSITATPMIHSLEFVFQLDLPTNLTPHRAYLKSTSEIYPLYGTSQSENRCTRPVRNLPRSSGRGPLQAWVKPTGAPEIFKGGTSDSSLVSIANAGLGSGRLQIARGCHALPPSRQGITGHSKR